jgi:hypothetical protein
MVIPEPSPSRAIEYLDITLAPYSDPNFTVIWSSEMVSWYPNV